MLEPTEPGTPGTTTTHPVLAFFLFWLIVFTANLAALWVWFG